MANVEQSPNCEVVRSVAYIFGNPWPICHDCKRHVYLVEDIGVWKHFRSSARCPHGSLACPDCDGVEDA